MAQTDERLYEGPVARSVLQNILPAMAASLLTLVYNMADSVFIGMVHNDLMQAAISLAAPLFMMFMSFGILFGVGGSSVMSRSLGAGNRERANAVSAFCIWACIGTGIVFMVLIWIFMDPILVVLGASEDIIGYTRTYLSIVTGSGVFSMTVNCFSNIIRSEGKPNIAMGGSLIGNILNTVLDPVFILGFGWGVAGAAAATVIGNLAGACFYYIYILSGKYSFSANIRDFRAGDKICTSVLSVGIPAALTSMLMSISSIIANSRVTLYGDLALAGYAMAAKVRMCFALIGNGIQQGFQPMLAYFYGAKNREKFKSSLIFTLIFSQIFFTIFIGLVFINPSPVLKLFLTNESALSYGVLFTRILLVGILTIGVYDIMLAVMQATGAGFAALIAALLRQGIIYIPLLFILDAVIGLNGLVMAQPVAEWSSLAIIVFQVWLILRRFFKEDDEVKGN